jgi:3-methylcrotonyl-CoA carboxylase alpha subunit
VSLASEALIDTDVDIATVSNWRIESVRQPMPPSVLIANRGEIACRIARTAKRLGMRTIAVYSDADQGALHTRLCDEAHWLGPAPARDSYLAIDKLIALAKRSGAACIHPGYGFLAENAAFAEACAAAGIVFVGPPAPAMRAMGLKDRAKALMERAGVPILAGYYGDRQETNFLRQKAYEIGYPLIIKAIAGGGGRGLRRVDKHAEFEAALESARREALSAFGDARVLIEKYVGSPRHIEIQIFADAHGNIIHLNERDCSLQRRHQKVIEEAPAPGMTPDLRATMGRAAIEAARAVAYVGAGTVEFIADASNDLRRDRFWFMEMNTRLQVEHPVTEAVTGVDLVEWQFRIAAGEALPLRQEEVQLGGYAVEARVYAEDPAHGFLPSTGRILALEFPEQNDIRIDTGVEAGSEVSPYYDAMIAKVIAHANSRDVAVESLGAALDQTLVVGPRTNVTFLSALLRSSEFHAGKFDTDFIDRNLAVLGAVPHAADQAAVALGVTRLLERQQEPVEDSGNVVLSPWDVDDAFQLSGPRTVALPVSADGEVVLATLSYGVGGVTVDVDGVAPAGDARIIETEDAVYVIRGRRQTIVKLMDIEAIDIAHVDTGGTVTAPMHGKVLEVLVRNGDPVSKGQRLAVIEAMKMEHSVLAPIDGRVAEIAVAAGSQVAEKAKIMVIAASQQA